MGDADGVGHLLLGVLGAAPQAKAQVHDLPLPVGEAVHRRQEQRLLGAFLDRAAGDIRLGAEDIREHELIAVPVGVQRFVDGDLSPLVLDLAEVHQDLVLDAAGGIGGQLDVFLRAEGIHRLDETDAPDGDQILQTDTGGFKLAGDVDDQPEIVLDQQAAGLRVPGGETPEHLLFGLPVKRGGQHLIPAEVVAAAGQQPVKQTVEQTGQQSPYPLGYSKHFSSLLTGMAE